MSEMNSSNNAMPTANFGRSMDFRAIYHMLIERVWIIAVCVVIAGLATVYKLQKTPRLYAATATLLVEQADQKVVNIQKVQQDDLRGLEVLRTIEQTLKNPALFERIIKVNGLDKNPNFVGITPEPPSMSQMTGALNNMIDVKLRRYTRLIDVSCVHTDPKIAALVANSLIAEFTKLNLEQYNASSEVASEFLVDEAQRLKKKLQVSEMAVQTYREKTKSVSLVERQDIVTQKLRELSARLTEAKSERIKREGQLAQVTELGTNITALIVLPFVAGDANVATAKARLDGAQSEFANLASRYKEKHPKYIQAQSQLEELRATFIKAVLKSSETAKASYESAKAAEVALQQAVKDQEAAAIELNKQVMEYTVLAREVDSDRALYESVINRLKETSLAKELPSNPIRLIQPATAPELPFSPNKPKMLLFGGFAGIFAGIGIIWLLNMIDSSFKTVDEAEESLGMAVLAAVPQVTDGKESTLIVAEDAKSHGAEAFRSLRTSLRMLGRDENRRTFLFTSALPQEGKTFCSTNFSLCLAQQGLRTVIIDGDLRRPAVELALTKERGKRRGVTDYLTGQAKLDEVICSTGHKDFYFIPAGTTAPNPAELLAQGHFEALIDEALTKFDRVVVDSAPIHAVSDTLVMLDRIQTVCLVVRAGKTPRKAVQRSIFLLKQAEAVMGGVILNRMRKRRNVGYNYYYDYSYKGSYSEKGVYGS